MKSNAVQTQIREIEAQNEKTRRKVRIALLILLLAGPLFLLAYPSVNLLNPTELNLTLRAVVDLLMFGAVFFVVLFYFWSLLNNAQFSTLHVSSKSLGFRPQKAQKDPLNIIYALALIAFLGLILKVLYDFLNKSIYPTDLLATLSFFLSVVVCSVLGFRVLAQTRNSRVFVNEPLLQDVLIEATGILPDRVRAGDSHSLFLDLTPTRDFLQRASCTDSHESHHYIEVELQAAGLTVDGDKRVKICETSKLPTSVWNCSFPTAGNQAINLRISLAKPDDTKNIIFTRKHDITVENALSVAWQPVLAILLSILSALVTLVR